MTKRTFKDPQIQAEIYEDSDIEDFSDPFKQPDTISMWGILGPPIKIIIAFVLGFVLLAHWPDVQEWLDKTFDKSDQMKTGIVMLGIGSVSFVVLFFITIFTRK